MKKDEIIQISLTLFLEKGYEKTTISDIMKKANLSKGGMYHHFASKEDILEAVIRKAMEEEDGEFIKQLKELQTFEEKFALLFSPNKSSSGYLKNFHLFTETHKKSLLYYKFREIRKEIGVKHLTAFVLEGISLGEFTTDYPEEMAQLLFNYGEDISFRSIEQEHKKAFLAKEFTVFLHIVQRLLHPSTAFIENFTIQLNTLTNTKG